VVSFLTEVIFSLSFAFQAFFFSDWHSFMDFATPAGFLPGLIGTDDNADILAQLLDVWINL
jgi:hypothetical protein